MTAYRWHFVFMGGFTALFVAIAPVHGDVTIVRNLKLKVQSGSGSIQARCATQLHGSMARRETETTISGALEKDFHYPIRTINWVSLNQGLVHTLDYSKSSIEKVSLSRWPRYLAERAESAENAGFQISQTWSRIIPEDEVKVVRGQRCRKFTYEWRFEVANSETYAKKQYGVRTTLWLTDLPPAVQRRLTEERSFQEGYHKRLGGRPLEDLNAVTMAYAAGVIGLDKETLFEAISQGTTHLQRIQGYPVASQTDWFLVGYKTNKPLFTVSSELEALSLKPLADTVFVPSRKYVSYYDEHDTNAQLMVKGD